MLAFGVVCFVLREMRHPMAPLVMGIVLGTRLDNNMRHGLVLGSGDPTPFITRPISAALCTLVVVSILLSLPAVGHRMGRLVRLRGRTG